METDEDRYTYWIGGVDPEAFYWYQVWLNWERGYYGDPDLYRYMRRKLRLRVPKSA